ncbi:YonK family protein [Lysinibacillus sp. NPDC086135]|uniref:YonK family protein n=1 Tax=Lysinibacillus sp. NPDC086135 TaxID=3364130 RepID=UPI0038102DD6
MKYTVDKYGIVKLIGEQENTIMAKENKGFGFNGELKFEDGKYIFIETVKGVEYPYNLSDKLGEYLNTHISLTVKLDTAIEPIED